MSWGWRKLLMVRSSIRHFFWYKLGDGKTASVWFDRWCPQSPIMSLFSVRDITREGFHLSYNVADLVHNGSWVWPNEWYTQIQILNNVTVPTLDPSKCNVLVWRGLNGDFQSFSVGAVWEAIRARDNEVIWASVVWFSHCIPRHAIHLWLVVKRKLKTQDALRQRDVGASIDLNLLQCSLFELQPDSHNLLFFECIFSSQVWNNVKMLIGMQNVAPVLDDIIAWLVPISKSRSVKSVLPKLVFVASTYFIWQERNLRIFQKRKRSKEQVIDVITSTVRLKLLSFQFKKSRNVVNLMDIWKIPQLEGK